MSLPNPSKPQVSFTRLESPFQPKASEESNKLENEEESDEPKTIEEPVESKTNEEPVESKTEEESDEPITKEESDEPKTKEEPDEPKTKEESDELKTKESGDANAQEQAKELRAKESIEANTQITKNVGQQAAEEDEEEGECGFCLFMKGGGCRDAFIAWENCVKGADKTKENMVENCFEVTGDLMKCMKAHPDYYAPILEVEKEIEGKQEDDETRLETLLVVEEDDMEK